MWILLKQQTVSGSGISWAICKSAPRSRQTTTPAPHHSVLQTGCPSCRPTNSVKALKCEHVNKNSHRHTRHDTDRTVLWCLVWLCELSRLDGQTDAFCLVCVGVWRSATARRTPTQNALVRPTQFTPPDRTQTGPSCLVWRVV